ncbi:metal ABC transporter permease [Persephonella atlantica]|uniref:Metal ABC transporter permease n=1 Tax=Persephonella atlantica TaxID=2699429 RepID=A0ABS1GG86_9AQUI|nr:metal ABC transporter permease [Persephonella atlantica]MBK3331930.1 metal ABC transporter permease [Persephonella atlantica]
MELLSIPFLQNAVIGGVLLAILLSVLSLFIYLKNWSFINIGISHATFGGLAVGFYLGLSPTLFGMLFAVFTGILIGYISKKGNIHEDISIGVLFSLSMAFGVIVITLSPNYNTDLFTFLFGNILTISREDVILLFMFSVISLGFVYFSFGKIMFCCYNEEVAYVSGINTAFYYYSLIIIIAVATVLSVKLVGVILSSAMMIIPAAFANQFFWHYRKMLIFSLSSSIFMVIAGIYISFLFDLPSGATIVFMYAALFVTVVASKKIFQRK